MLSREAGQPGSKGEKQMPAKKLGRPKIQFNLEEVEKLGSIGASYEEIAGWFDCTTRTIDNRMADTDGEFFRAYKRGSTDLKRSLRRDQIEAARKGNATLLIWLGKQLLGQSDKIETKSEVKQDVKMKLTPEMEAEIQKAAQVVNNDRRLTPHG